MGTRAGWAAGLLAAALGVAAPAGATTDTEVAERFAKATEVFTTMASGRGGTQIPHDVLAQARAIGVFPGVAKGAIIFGGRYGRGIVSVRRSDGRWGAPAFFTIGGEASGSSPAARSSISGWWS